MKTTKHRKRLLLEIENLAQEKRELERVVMLLDIEIKNIMREKARLTELIMEEVWDEVSAM